MEIVLGILCLVLLGAVTYLVSRKPKQDTAIVEWMRTSQLQMQELQRTLLENSRDSNQHLSTSIQQQTREIHERLSKAAEVIGELKREAGSFSEVSKSMRDLDTLLKSPKLRGNLGERVLTDLLSQVFPKSAFSLQYRFSTGNIVDAAIRTDAGILPIDSKFPMEHFQAMLKGDTEELREQNKREFVRDVKKHISAIASKYILPKEGTMDFALMYVPSESVYYEIAANDELLDFARAQRVYPVSPTTFYAHLQTILLSFEGKKMESKAGEVFALLRGLKKDLSVLDERMNLLGKHLTNATNTYTTVHTQIGTVQRNLAHAELESGEVKEMIEEREELEIKA